MTTVQLLNTSNVKSLHVNIAVQSWYYLIDVLFDIDVLIFRWCSSYVYIKPESVHVQVARKLVIVEGELERTEERAELSEG